MTLVVEYRNVCMNMIRAKGSEDLVNYRRPCHFFFQKIQTVYAIQNASLAFLYTLFSTAPKQHQLRNAIYTVKMYMNDMHNFESSSSSHGQLD